MLTCHLLMLVDIWGRERRLVTTIMKIPPPIINLVIDYHLKSMDIEQEEDQDVAMMLQEPDSSLMPYDIVVSDFVRPVYAE